MQSSKALADQIHQITYGLEGQQEFLLPGSHSEAKNAAQNKSVYGLAAQLPKAEWLT
jgi:hypothetical protein